MTTTSTSLSVAAPRGTMRTVLHQRYGGPEHLRIATVPRPTPVESQVLVRVRAASINAMDVRLMRANPFLVRFQLGLFRPRRPTLGADLAGVVEAIGPLVTTLSVGDEVFGEASFADGLGAFAEYVCVREQAIVKKPASLGFTSAAAVPLASATALQAVRDRAKLREGQSVLIQGAGGGVGLALVQLAKVFGANVTAVCGAGSMELVRSSGADRVIDYARDELMRSNESYDAVFGVNGYRPLSTYRDLLKKGGVYVMIGGTNRQLFEALLFGKIVIRGAGRRAEVLTTDESLRTSDLEALSALLLDGKLRPIVDRVFSLEDVAEAMAYAERGHVRGKIVLEMK